MKPDAPTIPRTRRPRRPVDAKLRARIELAVERLLFALDALDAPAEDREEDDPAGLGNEDDEPSLGWAEFEARYERYQASPLELTDGELDDSGAEPNLGSGAAGESASQGLWASGARDDREDEHDGAEPDEDGEPDLGSFDRMANQEKSYRQREGCGGGLDLDGEYDPADDEPSLGSIGSGYGADRCSQERWAAGGRRDGEAEEDDPGELEGDDEPSLGSFDQMHDQRKSWRQREGGGFVLDGEDDQSDREPSLGSIAGEHSNWAAGGSSDLEDDGAEPAA